MVNKYSLCQYGNGFYTNRHLFLRKTKITTLCDLCGLIFFTITRSIGSEKVHALANYQRVNPSLSGHLSEAHRSCSYITRSLAVPRYAGIAQSLASRMNSENSSPLKFRISALLTPILATHTFCIHFKKHGKTHLRSF